MERCRPSPIELSSHPTRTGRTTLFLISLLLFLLGDQTCQARKSWADVAASGTTTTDESTKDTCHCQTEPVKSPVKRGTAIYAKLPRGAERHDVRNVYDGDTLTLTNGRRVRFLGIDTPEIDSNQPFSKETKAYSRRHCHKKQIFLTFDQYGDKEDKFGRLLAFVWAKVDGGFLNVNEGIVAEGLATVYLPRKDAKLSNLRKLVALQKEARLARRGIWKNFKDYKVFVTPFGAAFHRSNCKHIANHRKSSIMASEAADKGLHPCRTCLSDQ